MSNFRKWYTWGFVTFLLMLIFGFLVSAAERGNDLWGTARYFRIVAQFPTTARQAYDQIRAKSNLLISKEDRECGVMIYDESFDDSNFVLTSEYNPQTGRSGVRLIRISDGSILHRWDPDFKGTSLASFKTRFRALPQVQNIQIFHPLLLQDGSIIFNRIYGPLARINKDSEFEWIVDGAFHHSIEFDADSMIWTSNNMPSSRFDTLLEKQNHQIEDNSIVKIDPSTGEVLYEKSLIEIFVNNGLEGIPFGSGVYTEDVFHLNDVQPVSDSSSYWLPGDLLLSIRNLSMIINYRPSNDSIVWYRQGPWFNQHDVNIVDDSTISIFGNDMYRTNRDGGPLLYGYNNVYFLDLHTDKVSKPYSQYFEKLDIDSKYGGRAQVLSQSGLIFIEETFDGKLWIMGPDELKWSYSSCVDEKHASIFSWCRYIDARSLPWLEQ